MRHTPTAADTWWHYVIQVAQTDSTVAIARVTGLNQSSVYRWQKTIPTVTSVRAFALAYGRPVLETFVAAGFLTPAEADHGATTIDGPTELRVIAARLVQLADTEVTA